MLPVREVTLAKEMGISVRTLSRWRAHGLAFFQARPGGAVLLRREDVENFLRRCHRADELEELVSSTCTALGLKLRSQRKVVSDASAAAALNGTRE